ncbi:MAG: Lrp/AsnC family transcriptional regulator [Sphingomonadaceae bacterium]|nr:Lrp/AsnC family transcriptional regulator [Sphingomonadaceae bacterium]
MLDPIDEAILVLLERNAGLTGAQIGEQVGLSPSAAHRRIKLLEEGGFIRGYRAMLSRAAQGDPSTVFVQVTLDDQRRDTLIRFEQTVSRCPQIVECHLMSGESDYLLKVLVRTSDSYERVHREVLATLPGVRRLVTHFSIRAVVEPA